ncbi:hypothetical protein [Oceanicaulis sp.]|uniref:hypothetical protein n=1 Tax=Oceanicaulis sp. TaxID=1924941 RepID=UPI0025D5F591|nr:hypothetical protein [Oceanicaulis sp.]|tara:strand:- start:1271 stop:1639 length:369 start_codon:yes stop_codon:yes gene_type:complete
MKKDSQGRYVDNPVHTWGGLYRTPYLVIPRMALEAMSLDWQERFVALMREADELGVETPDYHVLRGDPEYTHVTKYDPDDESSRDYEYTAWRSDPWANYRHPDYSLLPEVLRPERFKDSNNG